MRTKVVVLLLAVVAVAGYAKAQSGQVFRDRGAYLQARSEYERQKAEYDRFQNLAQVPVVAGYDLIVKGRDEDQPPGFAEQLLPTYTGEKVSFQELTTSTGVEPGNTPPNYVHSGIIPAKRPKGAFADPLGVTSAPSQDTSFAPASVEAVAPAPIDAPAPFDAPAPVEASTLAETPISATPATHALFFGRGGLPVTTATAAQLFRLDAPTPALSIGSPILFGPGAPRPVPLRPLGREFQFTPQQPFNDFVPGPVRSLGPQVVQTFQADAPAPPTAVPRPFVRYGPPTRRR